MVYKIWAVLLLPKNSILSRVTLKSFSFSFLWHQTRNFKTSKHIAILQQFLYKCVFFSFTQRDVKEGGGDLVGASLLSITLVGVTVQEKFLSFSEKDVFSYGDSHVYQTGKRLTEVFQCHFTKNSQDNTNPWVYWVGLLSQLRPGTVYCFLRTIQVTRLFLCLYPLEYTLHENRCFCFFFFGLFSALVYPKCLE